MFLWPWLLTALLLIPLAVWLYRKGLKPAAKQTLAHPDLALLAEAGSSGKRYWKHLPSVFYFAAGLFTLVALARPTMLIPEANPLTGIILAIDTSRSMRTADIAPNRFEAARQAVRDFIDALPEGARVGLVTFAGYATNTVPLTADHEQLLQALNLLYLGRGTAIGEALLKSLEALPSLEERQILSTDPKSLATIILLSDGRNRGGINPLDVLDELKAQQITVHTIGVGSADTNFSNAPDGFGFGGASRFDEATLRTIAEETGGKFVFADSASDLHNVYQELGKTLAWRWKRDEATAYAALAAAFLLVISLSVSQLRRTVF